MNSANNVAKRKAGIRKALAPFLFLSSPIFSRLPTCTLRVPIFDSCNEIKKWFFESSSDYKHHNTYKALIGITPAGGLSLVSELFPGSVSDRETV